MPVLNLYHLTFPHGLHIGRGGVESIEETLDYIPSDTLFSALLDTWVHLGKQVDEILRSSSTPIFRVTSAFPFAGKVRFYPKPVDLRALFSEKMLQGEGAGKRLKGIRWISEGLLEKSANGLFLDEFLFPEDEDEEPKSGVALQGGAYWLLDEEVPSLPQSMQMERSKHAVVRRKIVSHDQIVPRVTVDRVSSATILFQSERLIFNKDCGLWFGAVGQISPLSELLAVLGDSGIGGERTAGYGSFIVDLITEREFTAPKTRAYLLSRYHPSNTEVDLLKNESSTYRLVNISGWLRTPHNTPAQRRKNIWMVTEGSLISGNPHGDAAEVSPEYENTDKKFPHAVYRSGFALGFEWKVKI